MTKNKSDSILSRNKSSYDILAFLTIGVFGIFLLRGAFQSIATPDESFYLTIPYRIILGDALLIDEWHASQLSAFALYLPMKLFVSITGGTDGIVLFFRCLFVLCQTAVSVFTYVRIRKYGSLPALISALLFLTYVVEQVHMLDYYTMTLMGFQVSGLILLTDERLTKPKLIFTGIVFAFTVTAQPFNSMVYFIYTLLVVLFLIYRKKKEFSAFAKRILSLDTWIYITVGIILTAIVFMIFMLSQASIGEIIRNAGNLFSGQDHNLPFSGEADSDMFSYHKIVTTLFSFTPLCFILSLITVIIVIADRKRQEHKKILLYLSISVMGIYFIALFLSAIRKPDAMLFRPYPLFLMTLVFILLKKEINKELLSLWLSGVLYTVFLGIISQALDYVGAIGFLLSDTALFPAAKELYNELSKEKAPAKNNKGRKNPLPALSLIAASILCAVTITAGGVVEFIDDVTAFSFGRQPEKAEITLTEGPLKGIKTGKNTSTEYMKIMEDMKTINKSTQGKVLVAGLIPWTYFCFDTPPATFTTWYIGNELYMFESYYEDESHRPQCIYIPDTSFYWGYSNKATALNHTRFFKNMFSGSTKDGEGGTIFYVENIK